MGILDSLFGKKKNTANLAKDRLSVLIASNRQSQGAASDFIPQMREEILAVIAKYVAIDRDSVKVTNTRNDGIDVLEIELALR